MSSDGTTTFVPPIPNFVGVTDFDEIQRRFIAAGRSILLGHSLDFGDGRHQWPITSMELYLHHAIWPDPTAHAARFPKMAAARQLETGTWYVHRAQRPAPDPSQSTGFGPAPNRSGIDLTAGSVDQGIFAGLLIAGIGTKSGSSTALKQIVRADAPDRLGETKWSVADRRIIAEINGTSVSSGPLKLVARKQLDRRLWISTRKGLRANLEEPFRSSLLRISTDERGFPL